MLNKRLVTIIFPLLFGAQVVISPISGGSSGGSGTVTQINTTSPITGGPITTTGTIECSTCGVTGSPLSQFAATTSAQLAGVISNETGSGLLVFATSPTLTTPTIGAATGTSLTLTGISSAAGFSEAYVQKVNADSPYTILATDSFLDCNAVGGAVTFNLPTAVGISGRIYNMKKTDASANACTLDGNGAQTIDGAATLATTTQFTSYTVISDGANWLIK